MMKDTTKNVITYLQGLDKTADVTAADVAEALDMSVKAVNGIFTFAIQNKGFGVRVPAEVEAEDGSHKAIKLLKLNDAGYALDVNAADAE